MIYGIPLSFRSVEGSKVPHEKEDMRSLSSLGEVLETPLRPDRAAAVFVPGFAVTSERT